MHSISSRCAVGVRLAVAALLSLGCPDGAGAVQVNETGVGQSYSTNAICRQNNCVNPVFPALQDLSLLESQVWQCQPRGTITHFLSFCRGAVDYHTALSLPSRDVGKSATVKEAVLAQEKAASTAFFYHLSALKKEPWEYRQPQETQDDCVRSVWRMVCNSHFPRAAPSCSEGAPTSYVRPCKNVCESYVAACDVRCCDESTRCVFETEVTLVSNKTVSQTGYVDASGPSLTCTGAARRGAAPPAVALLAAASLFLAGLAPAQPGRERAAGAPRKRSPARRALAALLSAVAATGLQGCDAVGHATANWEQQPSYVTTFAYLPSQDKLPAGQFQLSARHAVLNSCGLATATAGSEVSREERCSGHGYCKAWPTASDEVSALRFCECDRDWADPECRTRRKSQAIAYTLSLLAGYTGLDHFYLGEFHSGMIKLGTLGGLGVWWILDIVRIGSAPVYASSGHRLAADLPHWAYVASVLATFAVLGHFALSRMLPAAHKQHRLRKSLLQAEETFFEGRNTALETEPMHHVGMPTKASYHVPLPTNFSYGTMVPDEVRRASHCNPMHPHSMFGEVEADTAYQYFQASHGVTAMPNLVDALDSADAAADASLDAGAVPPPTPPATPPGSSAQLRAHADEGRRLPLQNH